jgi:hypothetical protein
VPGVHRHGDSRYCGATTIVEGQNSVYVNGELWAVDGDPCTHGNGDCRAIYGASNVYINNKKVICAVGDTAYSADNNTHDPGPVDPKGHSNDVIIYGGAAGGR